MNSIFSKFRNHAACAVWMMIGLTLLVAGCAGTGKPPYSVDTYLLNYSSPSSAGQTPVAVSIKFNRFSIAAVYNTTNMIFRGDAYSIDAFNYSRWAVNPADMVADNLLGDLRAGGLYAAAFSRHDANDGRFVVSGGIEEFYLKTDGSTKKAVISLVISLQDANEIRTAGKMLFQKKYHREEPLQESSPRGYAQAASLAMQALSGEINKDIYSAVKTGLH